MLYKTNDTLNQFMKGTIHFNVLFVVLTLKEILTWKWTKFQFMKETNHFNVLFVELTLQEIPTWKRTMFQIMKKEAFQVQNLWCYFFTKYSLERVHSFDSWLSWRKQAFVMQQLCCLICTKYQLENLQSFTYAGKKPSECDYLQKEWRQWNNMGSPF